MRYTQEQVAKACGTSQGSVSNWLGLRTRPTGLSRKALQDNFPELLQELEEKWKLKKEKSL